MSDTSIFYDDLILLNIFSNFKIKKLHSIATVCKKWSKIVAELLAIRDKSPHIQLTLFQVGK